LQVYDCNTLHKHDNKDDDEDDDSDDDYDDDYDRNQAFKTHNNKFTVLILSPHAHNGT